MIAYYTNSIDRSANELIYQRGNRASGMHFFTPSELIGISAGGSRSRVLQEQETEKFLDDACISQWPRFQ